MARWKLRGLLCVLLYFTSVSAQSWDAPYFIEPPPGEPGNVQFSELTGTIAFITMDEVDVAGVLIATMTYTGGTKPVLGGESVRIGLDSKQNANSQWELFLTKALDRETQGKLFLISVNAAGVTGEIRLSVQDVNDNPPYFELDGSTDCKVNEADVVGETPCKFIIKDLDENFRDNVVLKATSPGLVLRLVGAVKADSIEATLHVDSPLDYETSRVHRISLSAQVSEDDPPTLIGTTTVILEVQDVADTNPYWLKRPLSIFNTKETETSSFDFEAADGDYGIDANILYELVGNVHPEITLEDNEGGAGKKLQVAPIDRESLAESTISVTIRAYEEDDTSAEITENILIIIEDVNDNSPVVTLDQSEVTVDEESLSSIGVVITVDDPDLGSAGTYVINLEDDSQVGWSSAFAIIPNTGYNRQTFTLNIIEPSKLDYEDPDWQIITLRIKVTESADPEHVSSEELKINLRDINDESPEFAEDNYEVSLREDVAIGTPIVTIQATDGDFGDTITYKLVTRNRAVALDGTTGVLTVAGAFNYEVQSEIILQAEARDLANHVTFTTITINLDDINDTPPIFDAIDAEIDEVPEGSPRGTEVTSNIRASDPDTTAQLELSIDWSKTKATRKGVPVVDTAIFIGCLDITSTPDPEQPDLGSSIFGTITVLDSNLVDYEKFDILYLVIVVTDTNTEDGFKDSTSATVTITIGNVNDEPPTFIISTIDSNKIIGENQVNSDTLIGYITAIDPDERDPIKYSLRPEDGTPDNWVFIGEEDGELRAVGDSNDMIDAERFAELKYTVIASDGDFDTESRIVIEVDDRNDEIPKFEPLPDKIPISEKPNSGELITTVHATDADSSEWFSRVSYLLDSLHSNYALVERYIEVDDQSGEVKVKELGGGSFLDPDDPTVGRELVVSIRVRDNFPPTSGKPVDSNEATITFTLQLLDVNDNAPVFGSYTLKTITEAVLQDSIVYAGIQATDADEPNTPFSIVIYTITNVREISGNNPDDTIFKLNQPNSQGIVDILAAKNLNGYFGEYEITVQGCDSDPNEPMCGEVKVRLDITDINDNKPVFVFPISAQKLRIRKEQDLGSALIQDDGTTLPAIQITDADAGINGEADFIITAVSPGYEEYFELNPSGDGKRAILQLTREFLDETPPPIDMTILARDRGIPEPLEETVTFKIYVIDKEEKPPVFSEFTGSTNFLENNAGLTYDFPKATDPNNMNEEEPENFQDINYFLVQGDAETFDLIDEKITLKKALDREEVDVHELKILATNNQIPTVGVDEQYFTLTITVTDVADFNPYFENDLYPGGIAPSDSKGVEVIRLTAVDEDSREIDKLRYNIDESSMTTSDPSLGNVANPFLLDADTGVLKTDFEPQTNMKGYFEFKVIVTDSQPASNSTTVKVYIINNSNRVVFEFNNEVEYVNSEREYIAMVFSKHIGYSCAIDDVSVSGTIESTRDTTITAVRTHFINTEKNEPVAGKEIERLALQKWNIMAVEMAERDLFLFNIVLSPSPDDQNLAAILTIVLIAVSVVLGSLVLVLFIAFVVKTRSLNRRLEALSNTKFGSQESGLNRIGMNVPNTNRHAVEGSNPVWNEDVPQYDNRSISSGDSDLIGVEDNPEFHYGKDQTEYRGSQEGGYYSGSDLQTAGRKEEAGHELITEL